MDRNMHMREILKIAAAILLVAIIIAVPYFYITAETRPYIMSDMGSVPVEGVGMVLGAGILNNGDLSPILRDRALAAIGLYQAKKISRIIVSGNDSGPNVDEVDPVKDFLIRNGIPAQDILTDGLGLDTYSSMYRAKNDYGITSLIIATQSFHLKRAVYIARSLGLDAYGLPADRGSYAIKNYLRELLADPKAIFDVIFHRVPQAYANPGK